MFCSHKCNNEINVMLVVCISKIHSDNFLVYKCLHEIGGRNAITESFLN